MPLVSGHHKKQDHSHDDFVDSKNHKHHDLVGPHEEHCSQPSATWYRRQRVRLQISSSETQGTDDEIYFLTLQSTVYRLWINQNIYNNCNNNEAVRASRIGLGPSGLR